MTIRTIALNFLFTFSILISNVLAEPGAGNWLRLHPRVASAIIWDSGEPKSYDQWSDEQKQALEIAYSKLTQWQRRGTQDENPLDLSVIPENVAKWKERLNMNGQWAPHISKSDAWDLYLASVAQSLAFESEKSTQGSLDRISNPGLEILFDSRRMFYPSQKGAVYRFSRNLTGDITPAPATVAYRFLKKNNLIGSSPKATIENLLEWTRNHLEHFVGDQSYANALKIWQYPGWPPLYSVLKGTVSKDDPKKAIAHYTAGCWGTVGFLISVLRTVNIPVALKEVCAENTHAAAHFTEENIFLTHGDDPYNQISRKKPRFPISHLLYSEKKWRETFERDDTTACKSVGGAPEKAANAFQQK